MEKPEQNKNTYHNPNGACIVKIGTGFFLYIAFLSVRKVLRSIMINAKQTTKFPFFCTSLGIISSSFSYDHKKGGVRSERVSGANLFHVYWLHKIRRVLKKIFLDSKSLL
jgi:hypothetical protein